MELTLEEALQKGVEAHKDGKVKEADQYYTAILKARPNHPDANHNMGVLAVGVGKANEALVFFKTALETSPNVAQFWLSYIDALIRLEKIEDALAVFNQAKDNGLKGKGFDKLKDNLNKLAKPTTLPTDPQSPPEHIMQSIINLYNQGEADRCLLEVMRLIKDFPNSHFLYNRLGILNTDVGRLDIAIAAYTKSIDLNPDNLEAFRNLGVALNGIFFTQPNVQLQSSIHKLLNMNQLVRPKDICKAAISLIKLDPKLNEHLEINKTSITKASYREIIEDLSELPLLLKLMSVCPLPDLEIENLLRMLRAELLFYKTPQIDLKKIIDFQIALGKQCFINEYIYNETEPEKRAVITLESDIEKAFTRRKKPSQHSILCLSSYRPLYKYRWSDQLSEYDNLDELIKQQITEPIQEIKIKQGLQAFTKIHHATSVKVRSQYEINPYPRWTDLHLYPEPLSIKELVHKVKIRLFDDKIIDTRSPEILVAGCGTGQHSIQTACRFKNSNVLAIDLSLSSLAYAVRKTRELNIQNIEYMQADILELPKLKRKFDVIESVGVIHHMENPFAGWKALSDILKPGGLMRVGLYSENARVAIAKIRQEMENTACIDSSEKLKLLRNKIINSDLQQYKQIVKSHDFFTISSLKDLLFHVKEHRFTAPKLKEYLFKLGLKFCGFEAPKLVINFEQSNSNKDDLYDLDKWQSFEESNPRAFASMYQFWCQKID